ncbi:MAG: hypothetical protein WBG95_17620 [Sulfitobacter sp.]
MSKKLYLTRPPLKVAEWDPTQGGGAYISFAEWIEVPGLEKADISLRFDRDNSLEEIQELVNKMKSMGFTFAIEK